MSQLRFTNRQNLYLRPDPARVVVRPFKPATEPRDLNPTDKVRANHIVGRVVRLDPETAAQQLSEVLDNFEGRHRNLIDIFETRAAEMEDALEPHAELNKTQRRLIGAYFLNEYSFEASALFNPSIVRHPDQTGAPEGGCRFILSLRAVGEGHISSLTFRSGTIAADGRSTPAAAAMVAPLVVAISFVDPGAQRQGTGRLRQGQSRQIELRRGDRHTAAYVRRDVQAHHRRQHCVRALQDRVAEDIDVFAGQMNMTFEGTTAIVPHIKIRRSARRLPSPAWREFRKVPDVPTMDELGYPGMPPDSWHASWRRPARRVRAPRPQAPRRRHSISDSANLALAACGRLPGPTRGNTPSSRGARIKYAREAGCRVGGIIPQSVRPAAADQEFSAAPPRLARRFSGRQQFQQRPRGLIGGAGKGLRRMRRQIAVVAFAQPPSAFCPCLSQATARCMAGSPGATCACASAISTDEVP